jgi:hypothetical protein
MSITVKELIRKLYEFNPKYVVEVFVEARFSGNYQDSRDESYEVNADSIIETTEGEGCIEIRV